MDFLDQSAPKRVAPSESKAVDPRVLGHCRSRRRDRRMYTYCRTNRCIQGLVAESDKGMSVVPQPGCNYRFSNRGCICIIVLVFDSCHAADHIHDDLLESQEITQFN